MGAYALFEGESLLPWSCPVGERDSPRSWVHLSFGIVLDSKSGLFRPYASRRREPFLRPDKIFRTMRAFARCWQGMQGFESEILTTAWVEVPSSSSSHGSDVRLRGCRASTMAVMATQRVGSGILGLDLSYAKHPALFVCRLNSHLPARTRLSRSRSLFSLSLCLSPSLSLKARRPCAQASMHDGRAADRRM